MNRDLRQTSVSNGAVVRMEVGADEVGSCVLCGSKSVCKCERCGDYYCSPQCQRKDWPSHRYICFPMPRLIKASNLAPLKMENGIAENKIPFLQSKLPDNNDHKEENPITSKGIEGTKMPTSESCVILTGFKSSNRCYIRSTNPSEEENYKKILKEIDDFGKTSSGLTGKPKTNSYALALREGKWCRVQIVGYNPDKRVRLQFVDYGDFCKRHQKDLRQITNHLISLPCLIHIIQLKDVKVVSIAPNLMESLSKYTNQEYKVVFENGGGRGGYAKLFNWKTKTLLNTCVVDLCTKCGNNEKPEEADIVSTNVSSTSNNAVNKNDLEQPTSSKNLNHHNGQVNKANSPTKNDKIENKTEKDNSPKSSVVSKRKTITKPHQIQTLKPCLEPPFKICPLNESDRDCKVIITDDSFVEAGYIGCLMEKYCANLKEVTTFLKQYVNDQPYQPKLHEYCLAQFENEWYRAKVIDIISNDKYRVTYIDFTNEMELTSKLIRRYPMSLSVPCHTTFCAIDGLPNDLSDELIDFLKSECSAFKELHIDNVRIVENVCNVESKELLKKLHNNLI